jgi:chromosome partitioning protein
VEGLSEPYDFVLFDCPPSLGILTTGALLASSEVIVSVETSFLSLHGVGLFLNSIGALKERFSHPLKVRALATMYDRRTLLAKEVLRDISGYFKDQLFDTVIHHNVKLREASSHGLPVHRYDPSSLGSKDYLAMAQELIVRTN